MFLDLNKMKNKTQKILEYLAENPKGKIEILAKFSLESIETLKRSEVLKFEGNNYNFVQEGVEIYIRDYAPKTNFLRI
jgi:hypothetical protein